MKTALAYTLSEAAEATPVSIDVLRRAIHATDPDGWPKPLPAKRLGRGRNAAYVVLADDLKEWLNGLPDA